MPSLWPWRKPRSGAPDAAQPLSLGDAGASVERRAPAPRDPGWRGVPPLQRVVGVQRLAAPLDSFTNSLRTRQNPSFLAPLAHNVSAKAPAGVVSGLIDVGRPVQRTGDTNLVLPARPARRPQEWGVRYADWFSPAAAGEPSEPQVVQRVADSSVPDSAAVPGEVTEESTESVGTAIVEDAATVTPVLPPPLPDRSAETSGEAHVTKTAARAPELQRRLVDDGFRAVAPPTIEGRIADQRDPLPVAGGRTAGDASAVQRDTADRPPNQVQDTQATPVTDAPPTTPVMSVFSDPAPPGPADISAPPALPVTQRTGGEISAGRPSAMSDPLHETPAAPPPPTPDAPAPSGPPEIRSVPTLPVTRRMVREVTTSLQPGTEPRPLTGFSPVESMVESVPGISSEPRQLPVAGPVPAPTVSRQMVDSEPMAPGMPNTEASTAPEQADPVAVEHVPAVSATKPAAPVVSNLAASDPADSLGLPLTQRTVGNVTAILTPGAGSRPLVGGSTPVDSAAASRPSIRSALQGPPDAGPIPVSTVPRHAADPGPMIPGMPTAEAPTTTQETDPVAVEHVPAPSAAADLPPTAPLPPTVAGTVGAQVTVARQIAVPLEMPIKVQRHRFPEVTHPGGKAPPPADRGASLARAVPEPRVAALLGAVSPATEPALTSLSIASPMPRSAVTRTPSPSPGQAYQKAEQAMPAPAGSPVTLMSPLLQRQAHAYASSPVGPVLADPVVTRTLPHAAPAVKSTHRQAGHADALPSARGPQRLPLEQLILQAQAATSAAASGYTEVVLHRESGEPSADVAPAPADPAPDAPESQSPNATAGLSAEPAGAAAAVPALSGAAGFRPTGSQLEELAELLYEPISARIRTELWLDRERSGLMVNLRR